METDTRRMRPDHAGRRPYVMSNLRAQQGLAEVVRFIETRGLRVTRGRVCSSAPRATRTPPSIRPPGHSPANGANTMGLMSFLKEAGEKLFGTGKAAAATPAATNATGASAAPDQVAALNQTAGKAIAHYVVAQGLKVDALDVSFDGTTSTVTVSGAVADQATKEKVLLCCGNVAGVAGVNDMLTVTHPEPEAQWHTVVSGDNLSKIAKKFYGDANKYPAILEANQPMLKHPDKIYPGQMLRIPPV